MSGALSAYLSDVERGLRGMAPGKRRLFLLELEGNLLDEAEARGLEGEAGMEALLAEKESPLDLAREILESDGGETTHRNEGALTGGMILGLATGTLLIIQNFPIYLAVSFGVAHGLAVGGGLFWLRPRWQRLDTQGRLVIATLMGTVLAIPLGLTKYIYSQGFLWSRLFYGGFTGYLVERHGERWRPLWQVFIETGLFTAFMLVLEFPLTRRLTKFTFTQIQKELVFNLTIAGAVLGALYIKRILSSRYVLGGRPGNSH